MTHYRLLTELPPRPMVPGPPPLPFAPLWARCCEELGERPRAAMEALMALDDAAPARPDEDPTALMRARMERALGLAEDAHSELLGAWLEHERALREALAARRAAVHERPWPVPTLDVADAAAAVAPAATAVMSIAEPLERQRALDTLRLRMLDQLVVDELGPDALLARIVAAHITERWAPSPVADPLEEVWT